MYFFYDCVKVSVIVIDKIVIFVSFMSDCGNVLFKYIVCVGIGDYDCGYIFV